LIAAAALRERVAAVGDRFSEPEGYNRGEHFSSTGSGETMKATITDESGKLLFDGDVTLRETAEGDLQSWTVVLTATDGHEFLLRRKVLVKLADGRRGQMFATTIKEASSGVTHIAFRGSGSLE
jgi:hypothetical protein